MDKIEKIEFNMKGQDKPRITKEQIKVLKEICSDAQLFGEFLTKMCFYLRETTGATKFQASFELDHTAIQKKALKGVLFYRSD